MSWHRRIGAHLARLTIVLHLALLALPAVDAFRFHRADDHRPTHIEAAGAECHGAQCLLASPSFTTTTLHSSTDAIFRWNEALLDVGSATAQVASRPAFGIPLGPRAPPSLS